MWRALIIVLASALLALPLAALAGLVMPQIPVTRPLLEAAVCGQDETMIRRTTVTNAVNTNMSYHCRTVDGVVGDSVTGQLFGQGLRMAWLPIAAVLALLLWGLAGLSRRFAQAALGRALR